jgi:integrase
MARVKLTFGRINDFTCPQDQKQVFLWDSELPGLAVRATLKTKTFIFQDKIGRKAIRVTIGNCQTWTLDAARSEARRLQMLFDQGLDPRQDRRKKLADTKRQEMEFDRSKITVGEAWSEYIMERRESWSARHLQDHLNAADPGGRKKLRGPGKTKPGPLAPLMTVKMSELTPALVKKWAAKEGARRGTQTRISFDALRTFASWADWHPKYKGLIPADACNNRIKRDTLPAKKAKDDCLQREQLPAWFDAVRGLHDPVMAAYLQGLLLTGGRRNELAAIKWADVDFRWNALIIHDKVEGLRTIPLTPYFKSLIYQLPRRNDFVFSSPKAESGRLVDPRRPHLRALALAGIEGLTLHGLRRSFGTLSEWVEAPVGVVAQIQGHKPSAIAEKHYRKRPLDLLRLWHEKIEAWILNQAGIDPPAQDADPGGLKLVKGFNNG